MVTFLTAKRAKVRKEAPQRNAFTPFLCGVFALSAAFAVIVTFVTAKRDKIRKGAPQRNAFTHIILIYFLLRAPRALRAISWSVLYNLKIPPLLPIRYHPAELPPFPIPRSGEMVHKFSPE